MSYGDAILLYKVSRPEALSLLSAPVPNLEILQINQLLAHFSGTFARINRNLPRRLHYQLPYSSPCRTTARRDE